MLTMEKGSMEYFVVAGPQANEFVEAVDLMPTLADFAGLPLPPTCPPNSFNVSYSVFEYTIQL